MRLCIKFGFVERGACVDASKLYLAVDVSIVWIKVILSRLNLRYREGSGLITSTHLLYPVPWSD